jgi:hypothetical protein
MRIPLNQKIKVGRHSAEDAQGAIKCIIQKMTAGSSIHIWKGIKKGQLRRSILQEAPQGHWVIIDMVHQMNNNVRHRGRDQHHQGVDTMAMTKGQDQHRQGVDFREEIRGVDEVGQLGHSEFATRGQILMQQLTPATHRGAWGGVFIIRMQWRVAS